jgi:hypothetical protein
MLAVVSRNSERRLVSGNYGCDVTAMAWLARDWPREYALKLTGAPTATWSARPTEPAFHAAAAPGDHSAERDTDSPTGVTLWFPLTTVLFPPVDSSQCCSSRSIRAGLFLPVGSGGAVPAGRLGPGCSCRSARAGLLPLVDSRAF